MIMIMNGWEKQESQKGRLNVKYGSVCECEIHHCAPGFLSEDGEATAGRIAKKEVLRQRGID